MGSVTPLRAHTSSSGRSTQATSTTRSSDELALRNLSLAESVARRYYRHDAARDEDLLQVAYIGLVKAARRYDPAKGDAFAAFAVPTISGEIKRHLRDNGWFIRPPRAVQELRARVRDATPELVQRLGRAPGAAEMAVELGVTTAQVEEAVACQQNITAASLDVRVGADQNDTLGDLIADEHDDAQRSEAAAILWSGSRALTPRERRVVQLRWFEDRTQQEIAREIGVTQMQVSRILSKTLDRLRVAIGVGADEQTARTA